MSSIDGRAGLNHQMLRTLQEKHEADPWQFTLCTLMLDGMSIKSEVRWNKQRGRMVGLVDLGETAVEEEEEDSAEYATEALVVMAVGVVGHWKRL